LAAAQGKVCSCAPVATAGCDVDSPEQPFVLTLTPATLELSYAPSLVPAQAAAHVLSAAASYVLLSAPTPQLSILNHPPQQSPSNPRFGLLHSGFEGAAANHPNRPALDFLTGLPGSHTVYTYAELNVIAARVATAIRSTAREEQRIVPVHLGVSPQLYISYLGILKSGRAFCLLPLDAPREHLDAVLTSLGSGVVVGRGVAPAGMDGRWLDVDAAIRNRIPAIATRAPRKVAPADVACVLYTSGSSGAPKAVEISHLSATCAIDSHERTLPLSTIPAMPSRWFQFSAATSGAAVVEVFVALSAGATLCAAAPELTASSAETVTTALRASVMMATPTLAAAIRPARMPTLRSLWTTGEVLVRSVVGGFAAGSSDCGIITADDRENGPRGLATAYGHVEGTVHCTLFPFPADYRSSVIGPPLPTCSLFVLDPKCKTPRPLPLGLAGELAIGGPQVAIGYLGQPAETARAFIDTEFGRLYRTGDSARIVWTANGEPLVEFLGRIGAEVTIGRNRVTLSDLDTAVAAARGVSQVATVVCSSQHTSKLVSCVVPTADGFVEEACEDAAADVLPAYLRPWKYITFPAFPTDSSGRLDRNALVEAVGAAFKDSTSSYTPATSSTAGDELPNSERAIAYWKTQLESFSPEPFPRLTGLKTNAIRRVSETVEITSKLSFAGLAERSRGVNCSPLAALQAAWGLILASYSDAMSEDNVFGTALAGSFDTGCGVVPTRINLAVIAAAPQPASVKAVVQHLSRANVAALEHLRYPTKALAGAHGELPYSTVLAFETPASDALYAVAEAPFAVVIEALPSTDGSLRLLATYRDEFLSRSGAEIMLRQMDDVLVHMLAHPDCVYTDVRSDVSPELRCTANPKPQGEPEPEDGPALQLHGQFEDHARSHPDDIAFVFRYDLEDDS